MKCSVCKSEMELWQQTIIDGKLIKRYRCACGNEQAEIVEKAKPKDKAE